jgi:hypothetical protein
MGADPFVSIVNADRLSELRDLLPGKTVLAGRDGTLGALPQPSGSPVIPLRWTPLPQAHRADIGTLAAPHPTRRHP